jgi:hypothetical protein
MPSSTPSARRKLRLQLILVIAVFAAPVIAAYLSYHFWPPQGRMNYGELLPVTPFADEALKTSDGKEFKLSSLKGKWVLLQVDSGQCTADCENKLRTTRQVRLALGKDQDRVELAWLIDDDLAVRSELEAKYPGTRRIRAGGSALLQQIAGEASARDQLYVVDPLGNLMMRYPKDPDAKRMLRDLNRLMKVSQVG